MAVAHVLARLRREPLEDCALARQVDQLCREQAHSWRDRILTPLVTVRLMLLQMLHGNTAVKHLRQLSGLDFAASSFCEARASDFHCYYCKSCCNGWRALPTAPRVS